MSKTWKHQNTYRYLNDTGRSLTLKDKIKVKRYFNRINFWDPDLKMIYRRVKDFKRGCDDQPRLKPRKYVRRG